MLLKIVFLAREPTARAKRDCDFNKMFFDMTLGALNLLKKKQYAKNSSALRQRIFSKIFLRHYLWK